MLSSSENVQASANALEQLKNLKVEDSNMAKIGSAEDKAHRKECASREPQWAKAGKSAGIEIWRVENFTLVPVVENIGKFHKGDSYIVFHTEKGEGNVMIHNIHFWLGAETSLDEQGTAAYKTVELDDFFDGEPTQHREVQGEESEQFHKLFPNLEYLEGGVDSGFRHVVPEGHDTKMYHSRRHKGNLTILRCPPCVDSLVKGDSFVLDAPNAIYVYNSPGSDAFEKKGASDHAEMLECKRAGRAMATLVEGSVCEEFWKVLGGKPEWEQPGCDGGAKSTFQLPKPPDHDTKLYQSKREQGRVSVSSCVVRRDSLRSGGSFVLDAADGIYVFHGDGSNAFEKNRAAAHAAQLESARGGKVKVRVSEVGDDEEEQFLNLLKGA